MNEKQLSTIRTRVQRVLQADWLEAEGRSTGFARRLRTVTPSRLALSLIGTFATQKVETIADLQRGFHAFTDRRVAYKPFYNQLAKPQFSRFMRRVFSHLLTELTLQVLRPLPESVLSRFSDILVQDGSSVTVHPALRERLPGRFTNRAPAAVEIHTTLSLFQDQVVRVSLSPDAGDERRYLPRAGSLAGKLLLADRGYDDLEYCRQVQEAGGVCIVRFKGNINPTVRSCWVDGQRRADLEGRPFQEVATALAGCNADLDAEWAPRRATARSKARPHTVRLRLVLLWNPTKRQHVVLATQLERATFSAAVVAQLYRLRWQVELLFKEWKSYANLEAVSTRNETMTKGLLWAAMAAALLKRFLAHATQGVFDGVVISTRRVAMASGESLRRLLQAALRQRRLGPLLRETLTYLAREGRRSRPKRDRETGRLQTGLEPCSGQALWFWSHA